MKKALKKMQEMQAFLTERGIDAHVDVTTSWERGVNHSCDIRVFDNDCTMVANVSYYSWRTDEFERAWNEFEAKVRERFYGWWE